MLTFLALKHRNVICIPYKFFPKCFSSVYMPILTIGLHYLRRDGKINIFIVKGQVSCLHSVHGRAGTLSFINMDKCKCAINKNILKIHSKFYFLYMKPRSFYCVDLYNFSQHLGYQLPRSNSIYMWLNIKLSTLFHIWFSW